MDSDIEENERVPESGIRHSVLSSLKATRHCRHLVVVAEAAPHGSTADSNVCGLLRDAHETFRESLLSEMAEDGGGAEPSPTCFWKGLQCACRYFWSLFYFVDMTMLDLQSIIAV